MGIERSISQAYDRFTNKRLNAHELFAVTKDAFEVRRQYHAKEIEPCCYECFQSLGISVSKFDRLFFKHHSHSDYCILKDGQLTELETDQFEWIHTAKESDRHKYLKNKLAELLRETLGVDSTSVFADDQFIFGDQGKRRPDVYCRFRDKELVFEIQLSNLPLRYILDRYNFYRSKGIYLVWILDRFDVQSQSQMVRDIKYLSAFQNFFKLDEVAKVFKLACTYKFPMISEECKVISPWRNRSLSLDQITFREEVMQICYFDYATELEKINRQCIDLRRKQIKEKEEEELREREQEADAKVRIIKERIASARKQGRAFNDFSPWLRQFSEFEMERLNLMLDLDQRTKSGKPRINHYIATMQDNDYSFMSFLLSERRLEFDVSLHDNAGVTAFQDLIKSPAQISKYALIKSLFNRGYKLTESDRNAYFETGNATDHEKDADLVLFKWLSEVDSPIDVGLIYRNTSILYTLESARQNRIIFFRLKGWKNIALNAVEKYKENWDCIELAFRKYGIWEQVFRDDKKHTFKNKLEKLNENKPSQNKLLEDQVIRVLFPEIFLNLSQSKKEIETGDDAKFCP
jgi:competence CoiA-like predicted nuclease